MSGRGVAALQTSQKAEKSGAPFSAGAAVNGLSVETAATGRIILGQPQAEPGDPGRLLFDTEIPMNGHRLTIGNVFTAIAMLIDQANGSYLFGDSMVNANGHALHIEDSISVTRLTANFGNTLYIDTSGSVFPGLYQFGDVSNVRTGLKLQIVDDTVATGRIFLSDAVGNYLIIDTGNLIANLTAPGLQGVGVNLTDAPGAAQAVLGITTAVNNPFVAASEATNSIDFANPANTVGININGVAGFTGVVAPVNTITVNNGIVTNVA